MQEEINWGGAHGARRERPHSAAAAAGEVVFASAEEQSQRVAELLGAGSLVITLPRPTIATRGHLGEILEELVERELARMGAPSPYLAAWSAMPEDAQARLADQLFRARTLGCSGIAIAMGSLAAIATPALTLDDSATLRWLAETTAQAPLVLLLDDADVGLVGYGAPVPISILLLAAPPAVAPPPTSASANDHDDVPDDNGTQWLTGDDATATDTRVAMMEPEAETELREPAEVAPAEEAPVEPVAVVEAAPPEPEAAPPEAAPPVRTRTRASAREARPAAVASTLPLLTNAPANATTSADGAWRMWTTALTNARGPQPLAMFERLFAESYVPLASAITAGLDDPRALRAHDEFRQSFERSYTDAFATFGATNRRPRLVMDAYDIASKQARLANARSAHILVVDSMRYDLGGLVRDAIGREATGLATLISEVVLWSSLPTTSIRQLETFARGMDALRAPARDEPSESLRGRAAEVVRRLRVGSRELYKLDLVPALLERAGKDAPTSLAAIAEATAESIARHISTLPARTLLFVVGDHGFTIDRRGELQSGGASPEEVLMPAQSWLIGDLH